MKKLSAKKLKKMWACSRGVSAFRRHFGEAEVEMVDVLAACIAAKKHSYARWLLWEYPILSSAQARKYALNLLPSVRWGRPALVAAALVLAAFSRRERNADLYSAYVKANRPEEFLNLLRSSRI